ncbi:MAG TPA: carbon-nitrogen hydrolase family protein [Candidatus Limnocylindrales bacterium]|jgi:beta-ureidopropionase|nr:carbon-nitrogen hydrolase family protein [Candidatus Limnocylindrales bacterium]
MKRRTFLASLSSLAALEAVPTLAAKSDEPIRTSSNSPPRKVVVGTTMQSFWGQYPGLRRRLEQLTGLVDEMAAQAKKVHKRGLDLAVLPEVSLTGEAGDDALAHSVPYEGEIRDAFKRKALEHKCYIVVPTYLLDSKEKKLYSNAAILVGRDGEVQGTYRKIHLVVSLERKNMEGGCTPGDSLPIFECDFGKLGIQICYDMEFDGGWAELARNGAELIAWPTQSPQTSQPAFRARQNRCYIVSSTWRHNASVFEPTGKIAAQIKPPQRILVHELDLSYALLPWSARLQNGEALRKGFGDKVGFRYYEDEDCGIFWSNDPKTPIGEMVRSIGVLELEEEMARVKQFYQAAGVRI